MDRKTAQKMLERMTEIVANEFPEFEAKFGRTTYENLGTISFKLDMVEKSAQKKIQERDENIGLAKNKVHPQAVGMEFQYNGSTYIVETVKTRKMKYSVVAKNQTNGKLSRFPASYINEKAFEEFGTKVRYVGNMAILDERA